MAGVMAAERPEPDHADLDLTVSQTLRGRRPPPKSRAVRIEPRKPKRSQV
jgi:hypothetical protein